jgi:hypothetical protein
MGGRTKTTLELPQDLTRAIGEVCQALGVPKNAFFAVASAMLVIKLLPMLPGRKRHDLLNQLDSLVQRVVMEAKKRA